MTDVVKVMEALFNAVDEVARYTRGGCHYNITTDNILLDYDGDDLKDIYLIGLLDMGLHIMARLLSRRKCMATVFVRRRLPMWDSTIFRTYIRLALS